MKKEKFNVVNLDINIILENPRMNPYILSMRKSLGQLMKISYNNISIKANTSDELGYIGREEGIMATATILLIKKK
jgi:2-C-methyl-D-erythritol 2,4-cyclodiphosphate synthase